jgi:hypothetical protein
MISTAPTHDNSRPMDGFMRMRHRTFGRRGMAVPFGTARSSEVSSVATGESRRYERPIRDQEVRRWGC